jgi:molybdate transport system regulatory protein
MAMNLLPGTIIGITSVEGISIVKVGMEKMVFTSIVLDTPAESPYLVKDHRVNLLFKETEVIIAREPPFAISVRNRIECRIKSIRPGGLLCDLTLYFTGIVTGREYFIRSIITREACDQLELKENEEVTALIKTNEMSLST